MAKLTLENLASLQNETSVINAINENNNQIEAALENTLSRDGTSPNSMGANLDMNSHRVLNLPEPLNPTEPARLADVASAAIDINFIDNSTFVSPFMTGLLDDVSATEAKATLEIPNNLREKLVADRTYYLRPDGSDSNDGLANTAGGAWRTPQKAMTVIAETLDFGGNNVTVQIADGTYDALYVTLTVGAGTVFWQGNQVTPANVIFRETNSLAGPVLDIENDASVAHWFRGIKFQNASAAGAGERRVAYVGRRNLIEFVDCQFVTNTSEPRVLNAARGAIIGLSGVCLVESAGGSGYQIVIDGGSLVFQGVGSSMTINGLDGSDGHLQVVNQGFCQYFAGNVTINAGPTVTQFVSVESGGYLEAFFTIWTGAVTGVRARVSKNGVIETFTSGINHFPGTIDPIVDTGGVYKYTTTTLGGHKTLSLWGKETPSFTTFSNVSLQAHSGTNTPVSSVLMHWAADDTGPSHRFYKSRSASINGVGVLQNNDRLGTILFLGDDGSVFQQSAAISCRVDGTPGDTDMPGRLVFFTTPDGSGTLSERLRINSQGFTSVTGCFGRGAPVTKTGDFTLASTENWVINNKAGSTCVVTLPAASSFIGREVTIQNYQAQLVNSASNNVVPLGGGAAAAAILSANAGRWATLVSDGTNWIIMAGVI